MFCLCGCDYGRRGGTYRLTFQPQPVNNSTIKVEANDVEKLQDLLGRWLSDRGFQEFRGKRTIWQKKGASVYVWEEVEGQVLIEFSAFGSKRDLRLSEETEIELLSYLEERRGLKVTRATPAEQI